MTRTLVARALALTPAVLAAGAALGQPGAGRLYIIPNLPHAPVINAENAVRAVADNGACAGEGADLNTQWYGIIFDDTSFQATRFDPAAGESVALGKFVSAFNSSTCYAMTPDGTQLFGASSIARSPTTQHNSRAMRWSASEGMVQLPIIPGDPEDTSFSIITAATPDGTLLMGGCGPATNNRWTAWPLGAGLPPFQFPDAAHDIGGTIASVSDDTHTVFGSAGANARAVIWTYGSSVFVPLALPGANNSSAAAMTPDGLTSAGTSDTIYNGQHVNHAFRYRADTGVVDLSTGLFPAQYHGAQAMSGDGTIVLGLYNAPLPQGVPAWQGYGVGWIWRQGRGITPIETYFTQELGLSLRGLVHSIPYAISRNGRWIACQAKDPTEQELFISFVVDTRPPLCGSADFDCDGDAGTDADIETFFACVAGSCPPAPCTSTADFDGDGDVGTDADIEAFFRVLAGGTC
jgi:hypothetical protein